MRQRNVATFVAWFAFVAWAPAVRATDAGPSEDAGPARCTTTADCSPPTPYCHPTLGTCVQCIADLNCLGLGFVCDQDRGVCTNCRSDGDCYGPAPYCSKSLRTCVECVTNANCGNQGVKCADGVCGSCGDGICSDKERNGVPGSDGMFGFCKDCFVGCPKTDLRSKTGDAVVSGTLSTNDGQYQTACGPTAGPGATFAWTAPSDGTYSLSVANGDAVFSVLSDDCSGQGLFCSTYFANLHFNKGQKVAIIVSSTTNSTGNFTLSIDPGDTLTCNPSFCPIGPGGEMPCCTADMACGVFGSSGCGPWMPGTGGFTGTGGSFDNTGGSEQSSGGIFQRGTGGGTLHDGMPVVTGGAHGRGGSPSSNDDAGIDTHHRPTTTSGGCGCTIPRDEESSGGALAALAGAGVLALSRRRRCGAARLR